MKSGIEYHAGEGLEKNLGAIEMECIQRFYFNSVQAVEAGTLMMQQEHISEHQDRSEMQEHKMDVSSTTLQQHMRKEKLFWEFSFEQF